MVPGAVDVGSLAVVVVASESAVVFAVPVASVVDDEPLSRLAMRRV